ncbi:hypothetical protein LTR36_002646 [Oleoguttula mirabilis]|uniref:Uncharacterized protein n=1 Tax=Oleoguttula mirabilis TaxID=1507867 RepID=A0AAV9JK58_9PEZI|nr:hypothetical protein LTR36_002646 [Oleoguttula mirabilis]
MAATGHYDQHACNLVGAMLRSLGLDSYVSPGTIFGLTDITSPGAKDTPMGWIPPRYRGAKRCAHVHTGGLAPAPEDLPDLARMDSAEPTSPTGSAAMSVSSGPSPPGSPPATPTTVSPTPPSPETASAAVAATNEASWQLTIAGITLELYSHGTPSTIKQGEGVWHHRHLRNASSSGEPETVVTIHTDPSAGGRPVYTPNPLMRAAPFQFRTCPSSGDARGVCAICDGRKKRVKRVKRESR